MDRPFLSEITSARNEGGMECFAFYYSASLC
jgi:hypothetical protein